MSTKARRRTWSLPEVLLGREPEKGAATYSYQNRQSRLVRNGSILHTAFFVAIVWFAAKANLALGIVVALWVLLNRIHYFIAAASDAVFDSLWERINQQSIYLNSRFRTLERKLDSLGSKYRTSGEDDLMESGGYSPDLHSAWEDYPERTWERRLERNVEELLSAKEPEDGPHG